MFDNKYPRIPREEFQQRWRKVQAMMAENDLDVLIAYSNDREIFGQAHARWLCDFPTHLEPVCIVFYRDGDPVAATGPESTEFIKNRSAIGEAYILREVIHPDEVYNLDQILGIEEVIAQRTALSGVSRVGIAGLNIMDVGVWAALQSFLKNREWVDVEEKLTHLRMIKSEAEVEVMRFCYDIAQKAFDAAVDAIVPGKSEMDVAAAVKSVMFQEGADGFGIEPMIGAGTQCGIGALSVDTAAHCRKRRCQTRNHTTIRRIQRNDRTAGVCGWVRRCHEKAFQRTG